jgi:hypothetical protein
MTTSFDRDLARDSAERLRQRRLELSSLAVPVGRGWEPVQAAMAEALVIHPTCIGDVISQLQRIQRMVKRLPPSRAKNRMCAFNSLYLKITRRVDGALTTGVHSPQFLEMLDVEFAKRYFAALDLWNRDDEETPDVWEVLFKRAQDERVSRLAAAMLGVNAHINHDLALALIDTWAELGAPEGDEIHPDYLLVNQIFYQEIPLLRRGFATEWQNDIDEFVGPLDDWSQRVLVRTTRAHAWDQALHLWQLRADPEDFEQARRTMDRAASLLGEWLIVTDRLVTETGWIGTLLRRLFGRGRRSASAVMTSSGVQQ